VLAMTAGENCDQMTYNGMVGLKQKLLIFGPDTGFAIYCTLYLIIANYRLNIGKEEHFAALCIKNLIRLRKSFGGEEGG
jgi:hypothetical protein